MKAAGLADLTVDQLIALKNSGRHAGIRPGTSRARLAGRCQQLIAMRVQDILPNIFADCAPRDSIPIRTQLIALKVQGADGEYYKGMKDAGLQPT